MAHFKDEQYRIGSTVWKTNEHFNHRGDLVQLSIDRYIIKKIISTIHGPYKIIQYEIEDVAGNLEIVDQVYLFQGAVSYCMTNYTHQTNIDHNFKSSLR